MPGGPRKNAGRKRSTGRGSNPTIRFCPTDPEQAQIEGEIATTGETPQQVLSRGLMALR